jgi:hypothetical protein
MIQSQHTCSRQHSLQQERHPLLEQHPVLVSFFLVGSAIFLMIASFFVGSVFPTFTLIGTSATFLYRLLAGVLGICGVLTSVISAIEHLDQLSTSAALFLHAKEHCYDRN